MTVVSHVSAVLCRSFAKFHYNDLLPTSWQLRWTSPSTGIGEVTGKRCNACNGFWAQAI